MNVVGKVSSFITQGVYSVATPFHPFGGAVDIIVVKQHDGTFRSTPWYVRFGKFQGVLKGAEKVVRIEVNGVESNFHMHLDNSGEAYFVREVDSDKDAAEGFKESDNLEVGREDNGTEYSTIESGLKGNDYFRQDSADFNDADVDVRDERAPLGMDRLERTESDSDRIFYEFQDEQSSLEGSVEFSEYGSSRYDNLDSVEHALESQDSDSEVILVSVDGHILTAPILSTETNAENVQLSTPQFHLGPGKGTEEYNRDDDTWTADYLTELDPSIPNVTSENICEVNKELSIEGNSENKSGRFIRHEVFKSCLDLPQLSVQSTNADRENEGSSGKVLDDPNKDSPSSSSINDEPEKGNLEISRYDDELSSPELHHVHDDSATIVDSKDSPSSSLINDELEKGNLEMSRNDDELSSNHSEINVDDDGSETTVSNNNQEAVKQVEEMKPDLSTGVEISLCGKLLHTGMGSDAAEKIFEENRISMEAFKLSGDEILKDENLIVRIRGKYLQWDKAAHTILGMAAFGLDPQVELHDVISVEQDNNNKTEAKEDELGMPSTPSRRWRLWPIPFRRVKTLEHSHSANEDVFVDSDSISNSVSTPTSATAKSPRKQILRTNVPTTDQIASLNLKEGQNMVNFIFSTRVLGSQKVEAHIYLWKWNTRIVISDVDGTITKSDVLGQFMPLVGKDWTHSGIARLFSAIKENGYQLLFLSARAIVQAYLTKSFLFNLKQDGKSLPNGPVVISPDGLFPSLYREVIRRAPHEFKIACLEDIKALFPPDYNPFYAGFGNRDTDELSYRKIGIPKGKIFIINPKGEVAINHRIDVKSYTSLHTLVHDMFPPTSLVEQEDYNSWNYWKMPLPDID
ncbi:hypothetical protein ABFX02_12G139200 [Erythranthe guttata]